MKHIRTRLRIASRSYLSGLAIYSIFIVTYRYSGYYHGLLLPETQRTINYLFFFFVFTGLFRLFYYPEKGYKPYELMRSIPEFVKSVYVFCLGYYRLKFEIKKEQKNLWLFTIVKGFYLPLMINYLITNLKNVNTSLNYSNILNILFTIDTAFFTFGYLIQHKRLGNTVKSVEQTMFGWLITLACYPPFNSVTGSLLGWYSVDNFSFNIPGFDNFARVAVLLMIGLYTWASVSLGFKCSNLTNRGVVTRGAYRWIRHPAYTGKVIAWWIMALPRFSLPMVISMSAWSLVYFFRAITEERHLSNDPDYRRYMKKVPYRFIPLVA